MGRILKLKERMIKTRSIIKRITHKLSDGNIKEYEIEYHFISTFLHIPKSWITEGIKEFKIIRIDDARSFLIIPKNTKKEHINIIRKVLSKIYRDILKGEGT
ncbi:MAG: hypothetical protein ACTSQA_03555 [Candidatus Heimdallarchaeaceae archaeon]